MNINNRIRILILMIKINYIYQYSQSNVFSNIKLNQFIMKQYYSKTEYEHFISITLNKEFRTH